MSEDYTTPDFSKVKEFHKEVLKEIYPYLQHDEDACKFVVAYGEYVEVIDDIIDEPKNPQLILKAFNQAMIIFSSPFWIKYHQQLMMVDVIINNQYADSVEWEHSIEKWKVEDAKCLSHCGYNMFYAIVCLVAGYDAMRKISSKFRQYSHIKHRQPIH